MGNKHSKRSDTTSPDVLKTYSELINMGFQEDLCLKAANKYPKNINKAIEQITKIQNLTHNNNLNNDTPEPISVVQQNEIKICTNTPDEKENKPYNEFYDEKNSCESVKTCSSFTRIINHLKFYHINNKSDIDYEKLSIYTELNKTSLVNDYHHLLEFHMNEDRISPLKTSEEFKLVYTILIAEEHNLFCDISKCQIYSRHNKNRKHIIKHNDSNLTFYIHLLDSIHAYFIHSVDTGYRIIDDLKINNESNDQNTFSELNAYLRSKKNNLREIRGPERVSNNKFMTKITMVADEDIKLSESKNEESYSIETADMPADLSDLSSVSSITRGSSLEIEMENKMNETYGQGYSFGERFNYWSNDCKQIQKYSFLKIEIICNKIYSLNMDQWYETYNKAKILIENSCKIAAMKIDISHLVSVILYTDYDTLSFNLSKTFRKSSVDEKKRQVSDRNREYFHWSKNLCETVQQFGTQMKDAEFDCLYHGVSCMYFTSFIAQFNAPTSTTTKLQVAAIFAHNNGIILELKKYKTSMDLKFFNCSFVSSFGNEDERLFIRPSREDGYYLLLSSIYNVTTDAQYRDEISAISAFEAMISDSYYKEAEDISSVSATIINDFISSNVSHYPNYIQDTFKHWANKIIKITVHVSKLQDASILLLHQTVSSLLLFDKINQIFKNVKVIECWNSGPISSAYYIVLLQMIDSIKKSEYPTLEKIRLCGDWSHCDTSIEEYFESQLVKKDWRLKHQHKRETQHFIDEKPRLSGNSWKNKYINYYILVYSRR